MAALADDDEAVQQMDLDAEPGPPSLTEFDPTTRGLRDLYQLMRQLIQVTTALHGQRAPAIPDPPRPRTAVDRARFRRRMERHRARSARLLPHKYGHN